ncbi:three-helix bundle dimerization domain-containing protein [Mycobacterium sp. 050134]|uniref:three-helix bundle dimerization domain-containing protein n=1 Tax=Mycobacterium sp. 050134 TaxID=3096111 RepID=UPI002ED7AFFD
MIQISEEALLEDIGRRLVGQFPRIAPEVVDELIRHEHARFAASRIRDFVPVLVEKNAREQLKQGLN